MNDRTRLPQRLGAYLERDLSPSDTAEVEALLAESPTARRRLECYQKIVDALAKTEPALESLDLVTAVRQQMAQPAPPSRPRRAPGWVVYTAGLAAAAFAVLTVGLRHIGGGDEVRSKGVAASASQRWAGIRLYRVTDNKPPVPIDGVVRVQDSVLVEYTNLGPEPFDYLMVFAVDAQKQVAWLYPAWEQASEDPVSIMARKGVVGQELRSLIRPVWAVGPLTIHALFTRQPLHVREVEAMLAHTTGLLPVADAAEQLISLTVAP